MGTIWKAEQHEPLKRTVAVKLIKRGMDSCQVIARFEAERQALAVMDHPNIARVLDAGTTKTGRPYFVMELVKGVPITQYCDDHNLTLDERIALMIPVCQAIQHAHQKGVLHRDVKPSNILVTSWDGQVVPKVIDFGIAKAIGQPLNESTLSTGFGGIVGTLEYMSPEQAGLNAIDVDTRSDVYSLGVLLYELLTGSTPLTRQRIKQAAILELLRIIREEEPSAPSTRISASGNEIAAISQHRRTEPARLARLIKGELDWIVMRALDRDRGRRYDSPNELAMDIQRYLSGARVLACPPSSIYRFRKFARQHRVAFATAFAIGAVMMVGTAVSVYQARLAGIAQRAAQAAEEEATKSRDELQQLTLFQQRQLSEINTELMGVRLRQSIEAQIRKELTGRGTSEQETADQLASMQSLLNSVNFTDVALTSMDENIFRTGLITIDTEYAGNPLLQASLKHTIAETMWGLGLHNAAVGPQSEALQIRRRILGSEDHLTLQSMTSLATILQAQGKLKEAEPVAAEALRLQRKVLGDRHPETLHTMQELGWNLGAQGRRSEGLALLTEALDGLRVQGAAETGDALVLMYYIAQIKQSEGLIHEVETLYREILSASRRIYWDDGGMALSVELSLGQNLIAQAKLEEAEPLVRAATEGYRRSNGNGYIHTLSAIGTLARLLRDLGQSEEAEKLEREALEGRRLSLGNDHPHTLISIESLAGLLRERGKLTEAEQLYREILDNQQRRSTTVGKSDPDTLAAMSLLGGCLLEQKKYDESEPLLKDSVDGLMQLMEVKDAGYSDETTRAIEQLVRLYSEWEKPELMLEWRTRLEQHRARGSEAVPQQQ
jgi:serine/threonine protein kinase